MLYPHIVGQFSEMWKNICLTIACAQQLVLFFFSEFILCTEQDQDPFDKK